MNPLRSIGRFAGIGLLVAAVGAASYTVATISTSTPVRQPGPIIALQSSLDSTLGTGRIGGIVTSFLAKSTDTLNIGDAVFLDTLGFVSKSATLANYNKLVGVVVGGRSDTMNVRTDSTSVGSAAALPLQKVIVMRWGLTWMFSDSLTAGLTAGTGVIPSSTTAGYIRARTTAIDSFNRVFGKSINGGAKSTKVQVLINVK